MHDVMYRALEAEGSEAADCSKAGRILVRQLTAAKQATPRK